MPGMPLPVSEGQRLAAAITALAGWTESADAVNIIVDSITTRFMSAPDADGNTHEVATVIFERNSETGEYAFRTG
jgi:hypothetical protein